MHKPSESQHIKKKKKIKKRKSRADLKKEWNVNCRCAFGEPLKNIRVREDGVLTESVFYVPLHVYSSIFFIVNRLPVLIIS